MEGEERESEGGSESPPPPPQPRLAVLATYAICCFLRDAAQEEKAGSAAELHRSAGQELRSVIGLDPAYSPLARQRRSKACSALYSSSTTPQRRTCRLLALVTASYPYLDNEIPRPEYLNPVHGSAGSR